MALFEIFKGPFLVYNCILFFYLKSSTLTCFAASRRSNNLDLHSIRTHISQTFSSVSIPTAISISPTPLSCHLQFVNTSYLSSFMFALFMIVGIAFFRTIYSNLEPLHTLSWPMRESASFHCSKYGCITAFSFKYLTYYSVWSRILNKSFSSVSSLFIFTS